MTPEKAMKSAAKGSPNNLLEALRRALGTLKDPKCPFRFDNWNACTCGHIYAASKRSTRVLRELGDHASRYSIINPPARTMYARMLDAIIGANDLSPNPHLSYQTPSHMVSDATDAPARKRSRRATGPSERGLRNAAVTLLEKAVAHVEQQERDAMLKVAR